MSSFLAGHTRAGPPTTHYSPVYHTTPHTASQGVNVTILLQFHYISITSTSPYPTRLDAYFVTPIYHVLARALYALASWKSWMSWELERHRPAGYCIQAALASWDTAQELGELGQAGTPSASWERAREFSSVTLSESWVPRIIHTNFWLAESCAIRLKIGRSWIRRKPKFRRRENSGPNSVWKKFF